MIMRLLRMWRIGLEPFWGHCVVQRVCIEDITLTVSLSLSTHECKLISANVKRNFKNFNGAGGGEGGCLLGISLAFLRAVETLCLINRR